MSLYDDEDDPGLGLESSASVADTGWGKSVSWMQSQQSLALKTKAKQTIPIPPPKVTPAFISRPRVTGFTEKAPKTLPPVINLQKNRQKSNDSPQSNSSKFSYGGGFEKGFRSDKGLLPLKDPDWTPVNEYDPLWPNDYHKVVQEMRDTKRTTDDDDPEWKKRRYTESGRERARERFRKDDGPSGFSRKPAGDDYSDEEDSNHSSRRRYDRSSSSSSAAGAAIAPPPSLTESSNPESSPSNDPNDSPSAGGVSLLQKMASTPATRGLGVAAKIMAKYGYKQGQGLGRSEQGMSQALSVEKTSKRGGRIVHEKDLMPPPPLFGEASTTPPQVDPEAEAEDQTKPTITDLMRNPSKVVLCKNMVGPGEVDGELEPEVKDECNTKYGDVNKVIIFELKNVVPEEAVRIFIEFKRIESAIKAVVDLNGRFFGGREVAASFYNTDKFQNLQLTD